MYEFVAARIPILVTTLAFVVLASSSSALATGDERPLRTKSSCSAKALGAVESSLLARVNTLRRSRGLAALRVSRGLSAAADHHSRQMVRHGFFAHDSRGGGRFWQRVERFYASRGFLAWEVGENLAYGAPRLDESKALRSWMRSPRHRANLLERRWREIGLSVVHAESPAGVFAGRSVTVVTADFGVRVPTGA
jgi:uncharacterized protein YkwD